MGVKGLFERSEPLFKKHRNAAKNASVLLQGGQNVNFNIERLRKTFGGLVAVNDVDLTVQEGTVHAIIGPNGAGKTTFFNCITGIYPPNSGAIVFNGEHLEGLPTHIISRKGIARTFQNIRLFRYMSVLDNVMVGAHHLTKYFLWSLALRNRRFKREEQEIREFCLYLLEKIGLVDKQHDFASSLPYGEQRKLEIARALASKPQMLLLDEPAAGMNDRETADLKNYIVSLREENYTILIIEHDMKLVMSLADTISVIDYGVKIAEGTATEVQSNELVIEAYLGKGGVK
jgi:branched-chain amino acid transport system ATP-binding protein